MLDLNCNAILFILFIYYKIVHTVQDRQNGTEQYKKEWYRSEVKVK